MSEKLNILGKTLINADLNGVESDLKKANTPQEYRARLELGPEGGYFVSTPRTAGELQMRLSYLKILN